MQKLNNILLLIAKEVALIICGVFFTLAASATLLKLIFSATHENYAFVLITSTLLGFVFFIVCFTSRFFKIATHRKISVSIAVLAASLAFQVIVPVTIERSITVFLLYELRAQPESLSREDLAIRFQEGYVKGRHMLQKRLAENSFSGNLDVRGDKVLLTRRGRAVVDFLSVTGRLFSVPKAVAPATGTTSP